MSTHRAMEMPNGETITLSQVDGNDWATLDSLDEACSLASARLAGGFSTPVAEYGKPVEYEVLRHGIRVALVRHSPSKNHSLRFVVVV